MTYESSFLRESESELLDSLAGKVTIKGKGKLTLKSIEPGLFESLNRQGKLVKMIDSKGWSTSIGRDGKQALGIRREPAPILSYLLTVSNDILIRTISQVAKFRYQEFN